MPRSRRVFVEGGIYHVYNRVTRGEGVFAEDAEAERLVEAMREVKQRDGLVVLAWCVMSNHYHLAVRSTSVPLWRSMASIHLEVSRGYNALYRVHGPFWQGRYKAKLVEDSTYLRQLVSYIHLNPVTAGVVERPEQYVLSGHRELVRRIRRPLVDPDQLLLVFGSRREEARKTYLESMSASRDEPWAGAGPGALPWWRFGRSGQAEQDGDLGIGAGTPFVDELGCGTAVERPFLVAGDFIERVSNALAVSAEEMAGRTKRREVVRAREILMTLAVERYGLRVTDVAAALGARYDSASVWGRRGAQRRSRDREFLHTIDELDVSLATGLRSESKKPRRRK